MLIQRHFLSGFFRLFAVVSVGLSLMLGALELIKRLDDFAPFDPPASQLLLYGALVLPRYFLYIMPVAALMCSLYTIGQASRGREIVAVMAAGGRLKRVLLPFVLSGLLLSLLGFVLGEVAVPSLSRQAKSLRDSIMHKAPMPSVYEEGTMWLRARDGSLVRVELYVEEEDYFDGMSIFKMGDGGLSEIARARRATYSPGEGSWILNGVTVYDAATGETASVEEFRYGLLDGPDVFREDVRKPYEMGMFELLRYVRKLREAGFHNPRLVVEMHSKVSYPLVSLFMVVLGISFASRRGLGGLAATAIGLLISLLYWFGYTMSLSMGYAGILPPLAAAWLMPALFGALSAVLFAAIPE